MAKTKVSAARKRPSAAPAATEKDDTSDVENKETTATSEPGKSTRKGIKKQPKDMKKKNKKQEDEDSDSDDQDTSMNSAKENKGKPQKNGKADESEEEESDNEQEEKVKNGKAKKTARKNKPNKNSNAAEEDGSSDEDENSSENEESEDNESNESPGNEESVKEKRDRNSLIIGNLPYTATNTMLQELLYTVLNKKDLKDCNIAAYNNGKTKGFAYVEVANKEAAEKVLQLNGYKMDGRTLLIAINDRRIDNIYAQVKNTLHIGFVSKTVTDGQIIEFLEKVIPINEIVRFERVKTFRGEPMGYLILEVASEEAAKQIKTLHEEVLDGRAITVHDYRTSVVNPNFLTTIHQNLKKGSQFKKNFSNNKRSGFGGNIDGPNKFMNQNKNFKKRAYSDRFDGNQKQPKFKKLKA